MATETRKPQESTVANADLWSRYFQEQWGAAGPLAQIAEGAAAQVASFLTFVAAAPIAWLYSTNTPAVMEVPHQAAPAPAEAHRAAPRDEFDDAA